MAIIGVREHSQWSLRETFSAAWNAAQTCRHGEYRACDLICLSQQSPRGAPSRPRS